MPHFTKLIALAALVSLSSLTYANDKIPVTIYNWSDFLVDWGKIKAHFKGGNFDITMHVGSHYTQEGGVSKGDYIKFTRYKDGGDQYICSATIPDNATSMTIYVKQYHGNSNCEAEVYVDGKMDKKNLN